MGYYVFKKTHYGRQSVRLKSDSLVYSFRALHFCKIELKNLKLSSNPPAEKKELQEFTEKVQN